MVLHTVLAFGARLALLATPLSSQALATSGPMAQQQIVTSPVELIDATPQVPGIVVSKAVTTPQVKKGTALFACGRDGALWRYGVGGCHPAVDIWAIAAPLRTYEAGTKYVWQNSYPADPINGKVIERIQATCKETCIWIGRASTGTTIRDVELTRIAPAKPGEIDAGIKVGGSKGGVATAGVLIDRIYSHGWQQNAKPGKYANGDGIVVNRGVIDVTVRNARLDDNADSGIDSKADLTTLDSVSASGNGHYGFRYWGVAKATTLICTNNAWGCIEAEAGARVTIDRLVMTGPEELVTTKAGAEINIAACDLSRWTGTVATKGPGKVTLGPSCKR